MHVRTSPSRSSRHYGSSASLYPRFGALLRQTGKQFYSAWWTVLGIELLFGATALFLQFLFFGGTALQVFAEAVRAGNANTLSSSSLVTLLRVSDAAYAVAIPAVLLALCLEVMHQGALFSIVAAPLRLGGFREALRNGFKHLRHYLALITLLFVSIALMNALLSLIASGVFRLTGTLQEGSTQAINRVFLLIFSALMLFVFLVYALSGIQVMLEKKGVLAALRGSVHWLRRAPWEIFWRAFVFILAMYLCFEIAGAVTLTFIGEITLQSLVSFLFVPFSFFFAFELYRAFLPSTLPSEDSSQEE